MSFYNELHTAWQNVVDFPFFYANQNELQNSPPPYVAYKIEELSFPKGFSTWEEPDQNKIFIPRRDKILYYIVANAERSETNISRLVTIYNCFIGFTYTPQFFDILENAGVAAQRFEKGLRTQNFDTGTFVVESIQVQVNYVYIYSTPMFHPRAAAPYNTSGETIDRIQGTNTATSTPIDTNS